MSTGAKAKIEPNHDNSTGRGWVDKAGDRFQPSSAGPSQLEPGSFLAEKER